MGVSCWSQIIFGVTSEMRGTSKVVTRFDEITGESYQKTISANQPVVVGASGAEYLMGDLIEAMEDYQHDEFIDNFRHGGYYSDAPLFGLRVTDCQFADDQPRRIFPDHMVKFDHIETLTFGLIPFLGDEGKAKDIAAASEFLLFTYAS